MASLLERFEAKVDRSGEHDVWTGSRLVDGSGKMKVEGRTVLARRVAWELAFGPLLTIIEVRSCPDERACVRVEHLSAPGAQIGQGPSGRKGTGHNRKGGGSMRELKPGRWALTVTAGRHPDGSVRRAYRTVTAEREGDAAKLLATFVAEVDDGERIAAKNLRASTMDDAIERFLSEHLRDEKGREERTVTGYRQLYLQWFSPVIGDRRVSQVDIASLDRIFGGMRRAGLSRSRLNHAKSLLGPFFRWARRRGMISRDPMVDFELPTSKHLSKERTPPEATELALFLAEAVRVVPDVAPVLVLGAATGMRRAELVGIRRSRIRWDDSQLIVDTAVDGQRLKSTKTRTERKVFVDHETMAMLRRHCDLMDERALEAGVVSSPDAFVFSLAIDCSEPMPPDYVTRRVALLKGCLGIEDKRRETVAREDEALRLFRSEPTIRPTGKTGPAPNGGMSFREIGRRLGRSERWAALAVASAQRRQKVATSGRILDFDGSIIALRKFTSTELLDAGFNISMVAQRQGHGPQVLAKHYAKRRQSSDRRAADHLGRVVHAGVP